MRMALKLLLPAASAGIKPAQPAAGRLVTGFCRQLLPPCQASLRELTIAGSSGRSDGASFSLTGRQPSAANSNGRRQQQRRLSSSPLLDGGEDVDTVEERGRSNGSSSSARGNGPSSTDGARAGSSGQRGASSSISKRNSDSNGGSSGTGGQAAGRGRGLGGASPGTARRAGPGTKGSAAPNGTAKREEGQQRLAKVLAAAGVASRRACEELIDQGKVKVNGTVITQQGTTVDPGKDVVHVDGKKVLVSAERQLFYFAINKPKGYYCSNVVPEGREGHRAIDLLKPWLDKFSGGAGAERDSRAGAERAPEAGPSGSAGATRRKPGLAKGALPPRLFTVGRLDVNTTGLLFITNDGQWANSVIHPSANITKEYTAVVGAKPTRAQLQALMDGTEVEGALVRPDEVALLPADRDRHMLRITVSEGKKHEVRELVAAAGMELRSLKRTRIGGLRIPQDLGIGRWKLLSATEVAQVTSPTAQARAAEAPYAAPPSQQQQQQGRARSGIVVPDVLMPLPRRRSGAV